MRWNITVANHQSMIRILAEIDNQAEDHRLRVMIPTGIASSVSISDNQFGVIKRPVYDEAMKYWEKEEWDERPDSIYPMLTYVGLSNEKEAVSILTNSSREFEIVGDNYETIAITLFRSIGVLGKEELVRRPGRPSGIKLPTPDSQMKGKLELDLALVVHPKSLSESNVARVAKEFVTPIQTYNRIPYHAMKLNADNFETPYSYSLLEEFDQDMVLSTLKKAENEDRLLLRFYNATDSVKQGIYKIPAHTKQVHEAKLNEESLHILDIDNGLFTIEVKPNQVKTVLL